MAMCPVPESSGSSRADGVRPNGVKQLTLLLLPGSLAGDSAMAFQDSAGCHGVDESVCAGLLAEPWLFGVVSLGAVIEPPPPQRRKDDARPDGRDGTAGDSGASGESGMPPMRISALEGPMTLVDGRMTLVEELLLARAREYPAREYGGFPAGVGGVIGSSRSRSAIQP